MGQICPCCNRYKNNNLKILTDINKIDSPPKYSLLNYSVPTYSPPRYSSPKKNSNIISPTLLSQNNIIQTKLLDNAIFQ